MDKMKILRSGTQETAAVMFSQGRKSKKTTKQNSQADNYNN
jgi:hypothetical protein